MVVNPVTPSRPLLVGAPHLDVSVSPLSPKEHYWAASALLM